MAFPQHHSLKKRKKRKLLDKLGFSESLNPPSGARWQVNRRNVFGERKQSKMQRQE